MKTHDEAAFEATIAEHLVEHGGYTFGHTKGMRDRLRKKPIQTRMGPRGTRTPEERMARKMNGGDGVPIRHKISV